MLFSIRIFSTALYITFINNLTDTFNPQFNYFIPIVKKDKKIIKQIQNLKVKDQEIC